VAVIVHLNNVFDDKPDVMQERMDYAFGKDGEEFWQKFFFCNELHPDVNVVYLFREHQLKVLFEYLENKKGISESIKKNLQKSSQDFFSSAKPGEPLVNVVKHTYYLKNTDDEKYGRFKYYKHYRHVKKIFFNPSDAEKNNKRKYPLKDFNDGEFEGEFLVAKTADEYREVFVCYLLQTRKPIKKLLRGFDSDIKAKEWLYYLGPIVYGHSCIRYCVNIDLDCPLVSRL